MKLREDLLKTPGRSTLGNVPEGVDACVLLRLLEEAASKKVPLLHVCRDDARMARLAEVLSFFAPNLDILSVPAWDCLPYDRVSPHRDIVSQRIAGLSRLISDKPPEIVLTTVNALLQRLPPRDLFEGRTLSARPGKSLPPEHLTAFLNENGFQRVETVAEPGEYALRGGIIDLFPAGEENPLRLDFFGDELESIRVFDPLSQRTTGKSDLLTLLPVNEVVLDEDTAERFRSGYRSAFGARVSEDPLYQAISEQRRHPGLEHWLPLFYEKLERLTDYLPNAPLSFDPQVGEARDVRLESIQDFYDARRQMEGQEQLDGAPYHPLPPDRLYLTASEWDQIVEARPSLFFTPFDQPSDEDRRVVDAGGRRPADFTAERKDSEGSLYKALAQFVSQEQKAGRQILIAGYSEGSRDRLHTVLKEHGLTRVAPVSDWQEAQSLPAQQAALVALGVEKGFGFGDLTVISEADILGERIVRSKTRKRRSDNFLTEVSTLHAGDYVVHVDHGIGRYEGLETLDVGGAPHDCVKVVYHGGDKLYVPVESIEVLSRYGSADTVAELDRLGHGNWQARKAKVKERLKETADHLIAVAAERELKQTETMNPPEGLYEEFCARFPYPETDDQLRAIEDLLNDLGSGKPMDRLICGDVGFGKTEVALRAAFIVAMSGRQVAVVVPTTLLARQHYETLKERFAGLPVRIGQLSRLTGSKEAAQVRQNLKDGTLDIVVGTHALLGKSVGFKDLGLLIIDEEQHFGVKQKERLKELRAEVHVLTLTATPIPRTLQLAMSGVKEMSLIATPPVDRLAVRTFVLPYDSVVIREAILREHFRGGQCFYVCPRLEDIAGVEERLRKLVPEVRIGVAHGQLPGTQLEEVMSAFVDHRYDVLLSTNIVESGLDIPAANTLIIHRADMFGLAQLYQLRGRVGRSKQRGYAYLTLPQGRILTKTAEKRLEVMQTLDTLGAGFTLASHDMDIRGAGNLLGEEQSGHVREVGVELYQQLLEEAVAAARSRQEDIQPESMGEDSWTPQINLGTSVLIPENYVSDLHVRMGLYRRLSTLVDRSEIESFAAELIDRFGPLPEEVENLLEIIAIKQLCRDAGVEKLDAGPKGAVLSFRGDSFANPGALVNFIERNPGKIQLRPDHKLVYRRAWEEPRDRMKGVRQLLDKLAQAAMKQAA
ncbi:transcription-repair coupling factor [Fodinicurvata fenggangensis]|uniref:transcription-repair coupling factor n=1 Tax=Fodinicurvata fenggangensis TaxID=1121830 RepID=UPI00047E0CF3|nr:transcription-repair coupling factor [Fodinicurvata fenggangensis]